MIATVLTIICLNKMLIYYILIGSGNMGLLLSLVSLSYIALILGLAGFLKGLKWLAFILVYTMISIVMFADVLYFSYFNQLTSVVMLKQFSQLFVIGDSISEVIKPVNYLLIADVIPLALYFIFKYRKSAPNIKRSANLKSHIGIAIISLFVIAASILMPKVLPYDFQISRWEFFSYHISDIHRSIFSKKETLDCDKLLLESIKRTVKKDKKLFGIAKDKNVITIQVEGLQNFVINREYNGQIITPNLNNLVKENSLYFDRYYQQLGRGNTSDAEFVSHNSLYPAMDGQTYIKYYKNTYYGLPWILKDKGYNTIAFHGYKASFWNRDKAYIYQGFDKFFSGETDYLINNPIIGFGINDSEFFSQTAGYMKTVEEPYYAFIVTLSSHHPFRMADMYKKIKIKKEHKDTTFGNYIQAINYADSAIGEFIKALKEMGLYNNIMLNIYGDHYGLMVNDANKDIMTEYLGYEYDYDEVMKVPLIIHIPGSGISQKISITGGQIDFLPTVLNLLGVENKRGIMLGQDLINAEEGFAAEQTYMQKGSYFKDDIAFYMSRDGIYKNSRAWNMITRQAIDLEQCREDYERAIEEINSSNYILRNDALKKYIVNRLDVAGENESTTGSISPEVLIASARSETRDTCNLKEFIDRLYDRGYIFIELVLHRTSAGALFLEGSSQMNIEDLINWLHNHKDVYIVTDIKGDNAEAMRFIKDNYPETMQRFIPQINKIDEFIPVQGFGFTNIILNLCDYGYSAEELIDFVRRHEVYAVTLPAEMIQTDLFNMLKEENIFVYTRVVSNMQIIKELRECGVDGFYISEK